MGNNCNLKTEFQQCIYCNSADEIECSYNGTVQTSRICKNYLSSCVTGIDAHGYTHRRCTGETDDEVEFPNNQMSVCTSNKCNTNIFPSNRLQCYRCEGGKDCDFVPLNSTGLATKSNATKSQLVPCGILSDSDQCYAYLAASKKFQISSLKFLIQNILHFEIFLFWNVSFLFGGKMFFV